MAQEGRSISILPCKALQLLYRSASEMYTEKHIYYSAEGCNKKVHNW